jgi:CRISPR system Cascade subunit CasE
MKMIQLSFSGLGDFSGRRGLEEATEGYVMHSVLAELFGDGAPPVFDACGHSVLAYSETTLGDLQSVAGLKAPPRLYRTCVWGDCAEKPMPSVPCGVDVGFEVQCVPTVRKASDGVGENSDGERREWHEGQELDVFLSEAWRRGQDADVERASVYRRWLDGHLERGGANLLEMEIKGFCVQKMTRRHHGCGLRTITRPAATLSGRLGVVDPNAFEDLLMSGLGRHTAFGYGMLKLEP